MISPKPFDVEQCLLLRFALKIKHILQVCECVVPEMEIKTD